MKMRALLDLPPGARALREGGKLRRGERTCPCGRHALAKTYAKTYAGKGCSMRAYHARREAAALAGLRPPEADRGAARTKRTAAPPAAPTVTPTATPVPPRPDSGTAIAAAPPRPGDGAAVLRALAALTGDSREPTAPPLPVVLDLTGKPGDGGKIADKIRALLELPASRLLTYFKPGTCPSSCRRGRWRGGWRLAAAPRVFLGRNLPTVRAAVEGFRVDGERLTLRDGTPLPGATVRTVREARRSLSDHRYTLSLPPQVVQAVSSYWRES